MQIYEGIVWPKFFQRPLLGLSGLLRFPEAASESHPPVGSIADVTASKVLWPRSEHHERHLLVANGIFMKNNIAVSWLLMGCLFGGQQAFAAREVAYATSPSWIDVAPAPTLSATAAEATYRVVYYDTQVRISAQGVETYTAYRIKLLKPEALALGSVVAIWQPDAGGVTVHQLRLIRDGKLIDVLKQAKFTVLQRENNLELAMLDGRLTATLQVPGVQVGDELEFAATLLQKDVTLGDHAFGVGALPSDGAPGAFRISVQWPKDLDLRWVVSKDFLVPKVLEVDGQKRLQLEQRDAPSAVFTDGAPGRFNVRRLLEYSDFKDWQEISKRLSSLYERAAKVSASSSLQTQIKAIKSGSNDPMVRAEAALRLVEEQVRYVYSGMDGGNFTPSTAEETWQRRFGDCKAKTVLLMALLRELGVQAEPMLVNLAGGDGLNERLPSPALFNHVLVRAVLGGKTYYLDGTRLGDLQLDRLPQTTFRWGLPLRAEGASLEAMPLRTPDEPDTIMVVEMDVTAGIDADTKVHMRQVMRGDGAIKVKSVLAAASAGDVDKFLRQYWQKSSDWVVIDSVGWRQSDVSNAVELSVSGSQVLDWSGDDTSGYRYTIPGAGFSPPSRLRRDKTQDQSAPWAVNYPDYRCWVTTVRLPDAGQQWQWTYHANPENRVMGGVHYWRAAALTGNVMRTVMSKRALVPEITAAEASQLNRDIAGFNNNMSHVDQTKKTGQALTRNLPAPFAVETDWLNTAAPCGPEAGK